MLDGTYPTRKFATLGLGNQPLFYLWGLARAEKEDPTPDKLYWKERSRETRIYLSFFVKPGLSPAYDLLACLFEANKYAGDNWFNIS